jgi:hypothetical protein
LRSYFANHIDISEDRHLLEKTIQALRSISIKNSDLCSLTTEAITRVWRSVVTTLTIGSTSGDVNAVTSTKDPLALTVRSRISVNHIADLLWVRKKGMKGYEDSYVSTMTQYDTAKQGTDADCDVSSAPQPPRAAVLSSASQPNIVTETV